MEDIRAYFTRPGFRRLFQLAKKRYQSLGRIGGEIRLSSITDDERDAISGLMGKDYTRHSTIVIRLATLDERLLETRFAIGLLEVLRLLYGVEVIPNRVVKEEKERNWRNFIDALIRSAEHPRVKNWLYQLADGGGQGYRTLRERFEREVVEGTAWMNELRLVIRALDRLPMYEGRVERLPIFAAHISGDPHFFDRDRFAGRLFYYGMLGVLSSDTVDDGPMDMEEPNSEVSRQTYFAAGILLDDLSSHVLTAWTDHHREEHSLWMTLRMIDQSSISNTLDKFIQQALLTRKVFVTENPSICGLILDKIQMIESESANHDFVNWSPLVCISGQPSLAAIRLFDLLTRQNIHLYYSGDFDSKGLEMAALLYKRYTNYWHPWGISSKALRYWKCTHWDRGDSGVFVSDEEKNSIMRMQTNWDEEIVSVLLNELEGQKVFEEMIIDYLVERYIEVHE